MGFVSPYTKITCPSCNNKYYQGDFEIVSRVTSNKVLYTPPKMKATPETNKLKLAWSRVWVKSPDDFEKELARLRCPNPNCHNILPRDNTDEGITIAIVGDTFSGKTHFITVVIDLLRRLNSWWLFRDYCSKPGN